MSLFTISFNSSEEDSEDELNQQSDNIFNQNEQFSECKLQQETENIIKDQSDINEKDQVQLCEISDDENFKQGKNEIHQFSSKSRNHVRGRGRCRGRPYSRGRGAGKSMIRHNSFTSAHRSSSNVQRKCKVNSLQDLSEKELSNSQKNDEISLETSNIPICKSASMTITQHHIKTVKNSHEIHNFPRPNSKKEITERKKNDSHTNDYLKNEQKEKDVMEEQINNKQDENQFTNEISKNDFSYQESSNIHETFAFSDEPIVEHFKTLTLLKMKHFMIRGMRIHYQLLEGSEPLYHTKIKSSKILQKIYISKGTEMHFSGAPFDAAILMSKDKMIFDLRETEEYGNEFLSIRYIKEDESKEFTIKVNFFVGKELFPYCLSAIHANLSTNQENAIVLKSFKGQEIIKIWMEGQDIIKIFGPQKMHPLFFMTLGISYELVNDINDNI